MDGALGPQRDDDELAFVVAKTMAHNMLGHSATQRNQAQKSGEPNNVSQFGIAG